MNTDDRLASPLVSALVTTYNHERFIVAAVESLIAQTYPNLEIIVVDDGSSDATAALLGSFEERGVRVLHTARKGPSVAMNLALSSAAGEIFLLQSGDDTSHPERAARQVETLRCCDIAACHPCLIDDEGSVLPDDRFSVFFEVASPIDRLDLFGLLYRKGNFLCAPSVAMRRSAWEAVGGFHQGLLQLQDYDYWMRALAVGCSIAIDSQRLVSYRLHTSNLSDSRHNVRTQRELATLLRNLAVILPDDLLVAEVYGGSFEGRSWSDAERRLLRSLFYLEHSSAFVRQIGVDALIALMDDPTFEENVETGFALDRQGIFQSLLHN